MSTPEEVRLPLGYAATTLFEIELAKLAGKVPSPMSPVEVRPGVGLVSLTVCTVEDGGVHGAHGALPAYGEAVFCVHVEPDLSDGVPDLSMLVLCFAATDARALAANEANHDLNVFPATIDIEVDPEHHRTRISDGDGPIAEVHCAHPDPTYTERPATLQVYTATAGGVRRYDERFEAHSFRHQRRLPSATLHDHPFFQGVSVRRLSRPFLQWLCEPGRPVLQVATTPTRPVQEAL